MSEPLLHIARRTDWDAAQGAEYRPPSLGSEGFVHCSSPAQLLRTAERHFTGEPDLVVLVLDPRLLASPVRWEGAGEAFPHVYGPVNREAVVRVIPLPAGMGGFVLPADVLPAPAPSTATPALEGVSNGAPAGARVTAGLIDVAIYLLIQVPLEMLLAVGITFGFGTAQQDLQDSIAGAASIALLLATRWIYLAVCDASSLRGSLGKVAMGIAVTRTDGSRVGFWRASLREWAKLVAALPTAGLALAIPVLLSRRGQGPHDLLADTIVVRRDAAAGAPAGPGAGAAPAPPQALVPASAPDPRPAGAPGNLLLAPSDLPRPLPGAPLAVDAGPGAAAAGVVYRDTSVVVSARVALLPDDAGATALHRAWRDAGAAGEAELHGGGWGDERHLGRSRGPAGDRFRWTCRAGRTVSSLDVSGPAEPATLLLALTLIGAQQRRIASSG